MLFNSYIFLLLFLPLCIVGYYAFNKSKRFTLGKLWLLGMSLWFYAYFNIKYLLIIVVSICFNYMICCAFFKCKSKPMRYSYLIVSLVANLGSLFYFKYFGFFIENINVIFETSFHFEKLILPLGISFFTFQQLSYLIDSFKGKVPNYNFLDYALFVTFFPQLIAGPIVTHNEIVPQFADVANKKFNSDNFSKGLMAFAFGLGKKVLIADTFGNAVNWGYQNLSILDSTNVALVILAYTFQIYFDFSGYCDMATGIGLLFNINIPMNFNSPYKALSVTDFWSRWHITLTRFFTTYIYIPLGGNRKGKIRMYLNTFIVFLVSGLWHGANWTFVLWGCIHGVAVIITKAFGNGFANIRNRVTKVVLKATGWIVTFGFINLSWVYFRSESITQGNSILKKLFDMNFGAINPDLTNTFNLPEILFFFKRLSIFLNIDILVKYPNLILVLLYGFALIACMFLKNTNERLICFKPKISNAVFTAVILTWCILSFSGVSTFLYFNF